MSYSFFYLSILAAWLIFFITLSYKKLELRHVCIGIVSCAISLTYDNILGSYLGLYYYINPGNSVLYIVLAGIFLFPVLNMIYALFLPQGHQKVLLYTGAWFTAMMLFEYASLLAGTVVFTGWRPFPWSVLTYIITYLWINILNRYLKGPAKSFLLRTLV